MEKDLDSRLLPDGRYRDALNWKMSTSSGSDVGAMENSLSNKKLTNFTLGAFPKTIGMFADNTDNKIYWFVVSDTLDSVLEYHEDTTLASIVVQDASGGILNFNKDFFITGVNLIVDSDNNTRFLCWTDNLNPPRCINIDRAKTYGLTGFDAADISLVKAPPLVPPVINLSNTPGVEENNIKERFLRIAYQYQYLDGEFSAFSPFTETAFLPGVFNFDFALASNEGMVNKFNNIDIAFNTGSDIVKSINLVFKESGSSVVFLIGNFNKSDEGWTNNLEVNQSFANNKVYEALPDDQLLRIFDAVPLKAQAQEVIGNRLLFGNYTENFDIETANGTRIPITFSLQKDTTAISNEVGTKSLKSNRDYEIGMFYKEDAGGRMTTVLVSPDNTIFFPNSDSIKQNKIKVTIPHEAPAFADKYGFFIKQSRVDYDTLVPTRFYEDGIYVWINLEGDEVNKISKGDFLYVKSDTKEILDGTVQTRVLEIKDQDENFLELPAVTTVEQLAGTYFRVKPTDFRLNISDFDFYTFESLDNTQTSNNNPIRSEVDVVEKAVYYGTTGLDDLTQSGTYTGSLDIRYIINIVDAAPSPDTFEWSDDDGSSFTGPIGITGGAQLMNNGVSVTFGAIDGHDATDTWIVSAKAVADNGFGTDEDNRSYSMFKSLPSNGNINIDDVIQGGAQITIEFIEYVNNTKVQDVNKTFTSSQRYVNLEEWFVRDNIINNLGTLVDANIWFRRGEASPAGGNRFFTQDATEDMTMIVRSQNTEGANQIITGYSKLEILQSDQHVIFETIPLNDDSQFFFEIGRTYSIDGSRNHLGFDAGDTSQSGLTNAQIILPVFNCFAWGNGFESYKIKDLFNAKSMKIDSRPLDTIPDYRQNVRIADLTYSKPYEQTTNFNGLNEFNLSTANFKSLDDKYASIQKLYSTDTDLIVFQEDKVHKILFSKDVLFDADGTGNIRESSKVLGQEVAYAGEYGISIEPESFAQYGNFRYFTDSRRGVVLRLAEDGITEISQNGMISYFRDSFLETKGGKKIGAYDLFNKQYVLSVNNTATVALQTVLAGTTIEMLSLGADPLIFISKVRASTGDVLINYDVTGTINVTVTEEGVLSDLGNITGTGTLNYSRTDDTVTELTITIDDVSAAPSFTITIPEPVDVLAAVVAAGDALSIFRNKSDDINVLFNDTFVDPVTVTITTPPVKGTAMVNSNQTINYIHGNADLLPDVLTYQIDDGTTTATEDANITILVDASGGPNGIAFNLSTKSFFSDIGSGEGACDFTIDDVKYHNGLGVYPVSGDTVYNELGITTLFAGGGKYYAIDGGKTIKISDAGVVDDLWLCGIDTV